MRFFIFTVLFFLWVPVSFGNEWTPVSGRLIKEAEILCGKTSCQDPVQALDLLSVAIELDSRNFHIYHYRGLIYLKIEEYDLAVKDFTTSIKLTNEAVGVIEKW